MHWRGDAATRKILPGLLLLLPFVLGAAWIISLPPGHGPDEEAHVGYVKVLVEERSFPVLSFSSQVGSAEGHQPPLYYMIAALASPVLGLGWGLRWLSLLMGFGSVLAYYGIALRLFPGRRLEAASMAATAGLLPMFSYLSATVNNGAMVQLAVAVVLYLGVEPRRWRGARSWWMGGFVAAAVLSKLSGLFLIPYLLIAWMRLLTEKRLSLEEVIRLSGRLFLVLLLLTGWWFWRNWLLYGDPLGWQQQMASAMALVRRARITPEYLYAVAVELWRSFWAAFGPAARQTASPSVYILLAMTVAPGVAGLMAARWSSRYGRLAGALLGGGVVAFLGWPLAVPWFSAWSPLVSGFLAKLLLALAVAALLVPAVAKIRWQLPGAIRREIGLLGLAFFLLLVGVYRYNIDFPHPQGRFLMPCVAPIVYLLQLGWIALLGWNRRSIPLGGGLLLALAANVLSLIHYAH